MSDPVKKGGTFTSKYGPTLPLGAIIEVDGASWEVAGKNGDEYTLNRVHVVGRERPRDNTAGSASTLTILEDTP